MGTCIGYKTLLENNYYYTVLELYHHFYENSHAIFLFENIWNPDNLDNFNGDLKQIIINTKKQKVCFVQEPGCFFFFMKSLIFHQHNTKSSHHRHSHHKQLLAKQNEVTQNVKTRQGKVKKLNLSFRFLFKYQTTYLHIW